MKPEMITKSEVQTRFGMTPAMVRDFLGGPDDERANPHYRSASPMQLFRLERVEAVTRSAAFKDRLAIAEKRRAARQEVTRRQVDELMAECQSIQFTVQRFPLDEVKSAAIKSWLAWQHSKDNWGAEVPEDWERLAVNFLRHELTTYDRQLAGLFGRVGKGQAYGVLKTRVLDSIAQTYPELARECERQRDGV